MSPSISSNPWSVTSHVLPLLLKYEPLCRLVNEHATPVYKRERKTVSQLPLGIAPHVLPEAHGRRPVERQVVSAWPEKSETTLQEVFRQLLSPSFRGLRLHWGRLPLARNRSENKRALKETSACHCEPWRPGRKGETASGTRPLSSCYDTILSS